MKKSIVILSLTASDAEWAVNYLRNNSNKSIIILSPTIEAQRLLRKNKIPSSLWYEIEIFEQTSLLNSTNNIYKKGNLLVKLLKKETYNLIPNVYGNSIFTLFKDSLSYIYIDIIHAYKLYKRILKTWHPEKIYIPSRFHQSYITGSGSFFSLAYYIDEYFKDDSLKVIPYQAKVKNDYLTTIFSSIREKILLIKYLLLKIFYSLNYIEYSDKVNPTSKKTVLLETGGIITSYYYKLYKLLSKKYNFLLITYKLQLHQQIPLIQRKIPYINFDSYWKNTHSNELYLLKNKFINKISKLRQFKDSTFLDNKAQQGAIIEQTIIFLQKNIEQILKKIIINKKILNEYKPNLAINSHDPSPTGLSLVLPAKDLKIKTLLLLHGLPMGKYHPSIYSDFLATWGRKTQKYFMKYSNLNKTKIYSCGFTLFDEYQDNLIKIKKNIPKSIHLSNNLKFGLLLTNYHPNDSYLSKFLHELISSLKDINITCNYRLHEGFSLNGIEKIGKEFNVKVNDRSFQSLDDFIISNDVILSLDTTAILWAMLHQKPLFHTLPIWGSGLIPTEQYKAAWIPKNATDLVKKIKEFINNPDVYQELLPGQKKFLEDFAGPLDGKSSERLSKIIDKLIRKHDSNEK